MPQDLLKNNSQLLYLQAKQKFEVAKKKFEDGSIKTETSLIQSVFQAFQDFFVSMGRPMMIPRYAIQDGPPWSEDYNNMMLEIKHDLELLFQEINVLSEALYTDFNYNMVQYNMITNEYNQILDKLKNLELVATNLTDNGKIVFCRNDFLNQNQIDFQRIVDKPVHIDHGMVSLPNKNAQNKATDAQVTIIVGNKTYQDFIIGSESNGFPGNNHEITVTPDGTMTGSDYLYQFIGAKNNHSSYGAVLDGNANTWFEYEMVNIRDLDKSAVAKNLGLDFQVYGSQTITWASEPTDNKLKLHMQVLLPEPKQINKINLNMYTPPNVGARPAIIKNIMISDGKSELQSIMPKDKKDDDYSFTFSPRLAKIISFEFEQPYKYFCDIGHIYYEQKKEITNTSAYVFDAISKNHTGSNLPRVDGPLMGLQDIGVEVKLANSSVEAYYPLQDAESMPNALEDVLNNLTENLNSENIDIGIERFEGWRYCIGIRDIEIWSCEYLESAEMITMPYYFDKPLDKISLSVDEMIPEDFYSNLTEKYQYLSYYISIDDGATWYPITPLERQSVSNVKDIPPKVYTIQQVSSENQQMTQQIGYIESTYPVYSVRLRATFNRPDDDVHKYASPILKSYTIKAYLKTDNDAGAPSSQRTHDIENDVNTTDMPYFSPVSKN